MELSRVVSRAQIKGVTSTGNDPVEADKVVKLDSNGLIDVTAVPVGDIHHGDLLDIGTNTHAQIDTHIADATKHRQINDGTTSTTGLWSSDKISTQLGTKVNSSLLGSANGVAQLDGDGKVPIGQLPASVVGSVEYIGTWDASTNTPILADGVGEKGNYYIVSAAATRNLGSGVIDWQISDWVINDGAKWDKVDNSEAPTTLTGAVTGTGIGTVVTSFSNSGVTAGTYNDAAKTVNAVVDAAGRITSLALTPITIVASQVTDLAASATTDTTNASNISSGTLDNTRLNLSTVPLDTLGAPTDVTTNDVTISAHGLCPKLPNNSTLFLNGAGLYTTPSGSYAAWTIVTSSVGSTPGDKLMVSTDLSPLIVTLPASPANGDWLEIQDMYNTWGTNNLTLDRNSNLINGSGSNYTATASGKRLSCIYTGSSFGWNIKEF